MEEQLIQAARHYGETARTLNEAAGEDRFDSGSSEYLHDMLMRLFGAIKLQEDMEKCRELLTEDTDEETVEIVMEAAQIVEEAGDKAFSIIEKYSAEHGEFAEKIENMTLGSEGGDRDGLLCELYKCESIIRLAYRVATQYPVYGPSDAFMGVAPNPPSADLEDYMTDNMDVDIMALLEAREKLLVAIEQFAEGKA